MLSWGKFLAMLARETSVTAIDRLLADPNSPVSRLTNSQKPQSSKRPVKVVKKVK